MGEREVGNRQTRTRVPHHGADEQLYVHERRRRRCKTSEPKVERFDAIRRRPFPAGDERERDGQTEKRLRERRVRDRHRRRQAQQNRDPAEHRLEEDREQRRRGEHAHRTAWLTDTAGGSRKSTVIPPSNAWNRTTPTQARPRRASQRRGSRNQSQAASAHSASPIPNT